jgi:hypothetical protein
MVSHTFLDLTDQSYTVKFDTDHGIVFMVCFLSRLPLALKGLGQIVLANQPRSPPAGLRDEVGYYDWLVPRRQLWWLELLNTMESSHVTPYTPPP